MPETPKLTDRQQQILDLVQSAIERSGAPPTRAEIANELGFRSANAAEEHLQALARKGAIEILPGASRGLRLRTAALPDSIRPALSRPLATWMPPARLSARARGRRRGPKEPNSTSMQHSR